MPSVEGVPARKAALTILDSVLRRGTTMDMAAQSVRGLSPPDLGLASAIAGEVLRRLPDLDALIDSATRQRLPGDSKARMVLRMALAQKIALGTPEHALVSTALPLVDGGPRRLVHGVLGTLLRRGVDPAGPPHLPAEVEDRWRQAWGDDVVEAARRQIASRPALDLSFASDEAAKAYAAAHEGVSLAAKHVRLTNAQAIPSLEGFNSGGWWVQDLAASLPARLVPDGARTVLDLCSAPGGKTMQLAAAGHRVTSLDISENRLKRLAENLERTGHKAELVAADALEWKHSDQFAAVLLDAPCSATGTFRRHPEVLYRARPRVIADGAQLQQRLLARAADWLKPGGVLVYSVCSLEPQEGEQVVRRFLESRKDFAVDAPREGELPASIAPDKRGFVRILPGLLESEGGLDGFFVARLVRSNA